jgi:toxin-antitoxin system PIN domain toxin
MTPDVNVLLAASRSDHPHHAVARAWLERAMAIAEGGGSLLVLPMVIAGFLRLATNPKIFRDPTPPDAAVAFIDSLLAIPGAELADLGREWPALKRLVRQHELTANDVPDAWIAAAVQTIGTRLVTFDRGFSRWLGRSELTLLPPH